MTAPPEARPSLHRDASAVLAGWTPPDEGQDAVRRVFLEHLAEHADGVWRECVPGHITASTAVLDPAGERVLLTLHRKLAMWLQLGGHCEPGDATLADAALREATEESGMAGLRLDPVPVQLDRHAVPCRGGSWHLDVQFLAVAPAGATPVVSDESDDVRWFGVDALPGDADDVVRRLVLGARARLVG